LPGFAYVHKGENNKWASGISANIVSGFGVDYLESSSNPILTPQPPNGYGFGSIQTQYNLIQVAPAYAHKLTENFSVGLAPILNIASLKSNPFPGAVPDDNNGDGSASYPTSGTAWAVGSGFQLGAYYKQKGVHAGVALKSPQWFSNFNYQSTDEIGQGRNFSFKLNFPMILSMGVGYSGIPKVKLMADAKYIDYSNTSGFEAGGFDPATGAVRGYGWKSIWAFSTGAEYKMSDNLSLRMGYLFNQNPISNDDTFFSIGAPGVIKNHFTTGFTYKISDKIDASLAYVLGLKNSTEGPFQSVSGPIANTSVKSTMSTQSVAFTLRYLF
jgi:long-chain fatty acid transport protein